MSDTQSPFDRLRALLGEAEPGAEPIDLTVGGPRHTPPAFIAQTIAEHAARFRDYPPIAGIPTFQTAARGYIERRYGTGDWFRHNGALLPTSGSRDGLFFTALCARDWLNKANPAVLFANPFYQTYVAAARAAGAEAVPLAMAAHGSILPDWNSVPAETLDRAIAYYVGSPANPDGTCATLADWHALIDRAERHNFLLLADECYGDLYRDAIGPPPGVLSAISERPDALSRVLLFHSLSKRSNLAGLRVGLMAGDARLITAVKDFRNQAAPQVPIPLQAAAAAAYADDAHVVDNRRLYDEKFQIAEDLLSPIFGPITPAGGFFLWLPTQKLGLGEDDEAATMALWRQTGVRGVPGSYLALTTTGQQNPGRGFLRLALVADATVTRKALGRVRELADRGQGREQVAFEDIERGAG